jgi:hypothetical protein
MVGPKDDESYTVSGIEADGIRRSYEKASLEDAGYLAAKMKDNGVRETRIHDGAGDEISTRAAFDAFVRRSQ